MRLVMWAVHQLERELIVERLTKGLAAAKACSKRVSQAGSVKVNGSKSIFEHHPPSKRQRQHMVKLARKVKTGEMSWRQLQVEFVKIQKRPGLGLATIRRQVAELQLMKR